MAVNTEEIATLAEAEFKSYSINARGASTIDAALDIQATGFKRAVKLALDMFIEQASVDGGTCVDGGPVTGAVIS